MENLSYIGLSAQDVMRRHMEVLANNLANQNTTGFKAQRMAFEEYLHNPNDTRPEFAEPLSMVNDVATFRDLRQGPLTHTGNTLDIAVEGRGYITGEGQTGQQ